MRITTCFSPQFYGAPRTFDVPADLGDEALFAGGGKPYATFDTFNATTLALVDNPNLYQINPTTGAARLVGPTVFQIKAAVDQGGTVYAFTAGGAELPSGAVERLTGLKRVKEKRPTPVIVVDHVDETRI